ncbi:Alpha-latrocrustotoxin-Lt1a [Bulinus truncatus]|nr:Alpha-latrocrustotoxin-Lt1a [Bulinus truncatus]
MSSSERNNYFEQKLIVAASNGDISTVSKILRKGICIKSTDVYGQTALSNASKAGHSELVRLLLESNADCVNQKVGPLVTPLHLAARNHHSNVVKHLVLAGASLDARNCNNLLPIDLCNFNSETWNVIKEAMSGKMPMLENKSEVPEIPKFALPQGTTVKGVKLKKGGKKKGKKNGGKKGKKKKGKKRKKNNVYFLEEIIAFYLLY